jgi:hypothetical protein
MPRARPLHKETGGIVLDTFRGLNTQKHASKLAPGELSFSLNNTSKWGNLRKEHGWTVVNSDELGKTGTPSRLTTDHTAYDGSNAGAISGVKAFRYIGSGGAMVTNYVAVCGAEVYHAIDNSTDPTSASYQLHTFSGTGASGDLPCFAEWDGYLFFSIGRETTSAAWGVDAIQVFDPLNRSGLGAGVHDFKAWADAVISTTFSATEDRRPLWMAVNWGYLVIAGTYNKSAATYSATTLYYVDLNSPANSWNTNILGQGEDYGDTYINGMIAYGDHIMIFTRHRDIVRFQNLTGLNIEGIAIGGTLGTDNARRIAYQNGCAAGHSLVLAGKRLLWLADDGVWMLESSESLLPVRVSEKLDGKDGIWDTVNLDHIEGACAIYDESLRQIVFSVPYNSSTVNNKEIVAQLPDNDYEAEDFRTWDWSLRDRVAGSLDYDKIAGKVLWGSSLDSGLVCLDSDSAVTGGPVTATNIGATGVSYTTTAMTDTGASFEVDALVGLPLTTPAQSTWITDNDGTSVTYLGLDAAPAANTEYAIGGILWHVIFNEFQKEDPVFWGTGFFRRIVNGTTTVYTDQYADGSPDATTAEYSVAGGLIPPFIPPQVIPAAGEVVEKLYSDKRATTMKLGFREHGYSSTPRVIRVDWPIHRLTRTRRR